MIASHTAALYTAVHRALTADLPELLRLAADALATVPAPPDLAGWSELTREELFRLAPVCGSLVVLLFGLPACVLCEPRIGRTGEYWLTRVALLRGIGLLYVFAFASSAMQGRALFGARGLFAPATGSSGPTPALDLLAAAGVGSADARVELASLCGLLLSLLDRKSGG